MKQHPFFMTKTAQVGGGGPAPEIPRGSPPPIYNATLSSAPKPVKKKPKKKTINTKTREAKLKQLYAIRKNVKH